MRQQENKRREDFDDDKSGAAGKYQTEPETIVDSKVDTAIARFS